MTDLKIPEQTTIDIQMTGVDAKLQPDGSARIYGFRVDDAACRLVGIAADPQEVNGIMREAEKTQSLPVIEVDKNRWFYVMTVGAGQAYFETGQEPNKP